MTETELKLEQLAKDATPGPWEADSSVGHIWAKHTGRPCFIARVAGGSDVILPWEANTRKSEPDDDRKQPGARSERDVPDADDLEELESLAHRWVRE